MMNGNENCERDTKRKKGGLSNVSSWCIIQSVNHISRNVSCHSFTVPIYFLVLLSLVYLLIHLFIHSHFNVCLSLPFPSYSLFQYIYNSSIIGSPMPCTLPTGLSFSLLLWKAESHNGTWCFWSTITDFLQMGKDKICKYISQCLQANSLAVSVYMPGDDSKVDNGSKLCRCCWLYKMS